MQPIQIIENNANFVVAVKPSGLDFHNDGDEIGFFNIVKQQLNLDECYPVHRLDKATSGLVIIAKTLEAEHIFNQAFAEHSIHKFYLAISDKKPKQKQGRVIGDMQKSRDKAWRLLASKNNPAKTFFYSYGLGDGVRLFLLKPYSGKTHQLRVALKALGSPILGDDIYKGAEQNRLYLHAYALSFEFNQQPYQFISIPNNSEFNWDNPPFETWLAEDVHQAILSNPTNLVWPAL